MKETLLEVEIRKVLDNVVQNGAYTQGHILILTEIAYKKEKELQENLKVLLDIKECYCD